MVVLELDTYLPSVTLFRSMNNWKGAFSLVGERLRHVGAEAEIDVFATSDALCESLMQARTFDALGILRDRFEAGFVGANFHADRLLILIDNGIRLRLGSSYRRKVDIETHAADVRRRLGPILALADNVRACAASAGVGADHTA